MEDVLLAYDMKLTFLSQQFYFDRYKETIISYFPEQETEKNKVYAKFKAYRDYVRQMLLLEHIPLSLMNEKVIINSTITLTARDRSHCLRYKVCLPVYENISLNHISFTSLLGADLLLQEINDTVNVMKDDIDKPYIISDIHIA